MDWAVSDELLGTFVPILVYWIYSGIYILLGSFENYRLHSRIDEDVKNLVSKGTVVKGVLLQQAIQAAVAIILFTVVNLVKLLLGVGTAKSDLDIFEKALLFRSQSFIRSDRTSEFENKEVAGDSGSAKDLRPSPFMLARQFLIAMLVIDTWQYFMHRYMHHNKFLYRHIHSLHHRLVVPYAFGALYNHPVEGLLGDTIGGALSFLLSGMSPRTSIFLFSFATIKTVDDHCGLWLPGNLFHLFFRNNTAYHDVHHQLYGSKYNFSQPFFVMWDRILGTYMPYSLEKRVGGGFEVRPTNDYKAD
ncbi:hypothetical protein HHK36_029775 [Tetracentron sinense]|uniref:Fatty acid hydroxylase domain-containing protein n=1 Tax=Tetracentron sinense TaxID=13715 RepID=A0A834YEJ2_TETSI|nr:hypothetical protein HHK36_029775 [Tetracentron sinense]